MKQKNEEEERETEEEERETEEGEHPEANEEAAEKVEETAEASEEEAAEIIEEEAEAEEEVKPLRKEKIEEEIVEERIYTIPLAKAWIAPSNKRAPKAMRIIENFLRRHMKLKTQGGLEEEEEPKRLIVSNDVNERVWTKGVQKPPRKIRVRAAKDKDGNVTVYLAEGD